MITREGAFWVRSEAEGRVRIVLPFEPFEPLGEAELAARFEAVLGAAGTYVLFIRLPRRSRITIGRGRGSGPFMIGPLVLYCGSYQKPEGIGARIARYARLERLRWNVDQLIERAGKRFEVVPRPGRPKEDECTMAERLGRELEATVIPRGNADCAADGRRWCRGHLIDLPLDRLDAARKLACA